MGEASRRGDRSTRLALALKETTPLKLDVRGEAQEGISSTSYSTIAESGREISPMEGVMPIVVKGPSGDDLRVVGTGFFVGPNMILTAKHVFDEGALPRFACLQIKDATNEFYFRQFRQVVGHPVSDVALCELHPMLHAEHKVALSNYVLPIGGPVPSPGLKLTTYAFPDTVVARHNGVLHMGIAGHHYDGAVLDVFPVQRDRVMLNFPCMRTSIHLHGGASGGPVINPETGMVVAINTSSFQGATNESHVTLIHPILDFPIYKTHYVGNVSLGITLRELSFRGSARVFPENSLVRHTAAPTIME